MYKKSGFCKKNVSQIKNQKECDGNANPLPYDDISIIDHTVHNIRNNSIVPGNI